MNYLVVPLAKEGEGTGHLLRAAEICRTVLPGGKITFLDSDVVTPRQKCLLEGVAQVKDPSLEAPWDFVLLDRRATTLQEYQQASQWGPVILLDDCGKARRHALLTLDTHLFPTNSPPNRRIFPLLFPVNCPRRKKRRGSFRNVLLSFGGEDFKELTSSLVGVLLREKLLKKKCITLVKGPLCRQDLTKWGVKILENYSNLGDVLKGYDLVFTSFGRTAFEAALSGIPVLLLNPTSYHRQVSRMAGFEEIGVRHISKKRLRFFLSHPKSLRGGPSVLEECSSLEKLPTLLAKLSLKKPQCPVCQKQRHLVVIQRFSDKTFYRCPECGVIFPVFIVASPSPSYDKEYFFQKHARQYGRTYLEDFDKIYQMGLGRVRRLKRFLKTSEYFSLLDVGCAYGAFLQAAKKEGAIGHGVEICPDAVEFVRTQLGIQVDCCSFPDKPEPFVGGRLHFDVVTMWYVIEHFSNLDEVLPKANEILRVGGILALSTPNAAGGSFKTNKTHFLKTSPDDHFTIWTPRALTKVLARYGFKKRGCVITGHHPERLPGSKGRSQGIRAFCLRGVSHLWGLGDTFELYLEKIEEAG